MLPGAVRIVGGRRVPAAKIHGPSLADLKRRKEDDKFVRERNERRERLQGGKISDGKRLVSLLKTIGAAVLGVVGAMVALIVVVRYSAITPAEAAARLISYATQWSEAHGLFAISALVLGGGGFFAVRALLAWLARRRAAATDKERVRQQAVASAQRLVALAAKRDFEQTEQHRLETMTEVALAQFAAQRKARHDELVATQTRQASLRSQAALWAPADQDCLDKALSGCRFDLYATEEDLWGYVASLVPGHSPDACRARYNHIQRFAPLPEELGVAPTTASVATAEQYADYSDGNDDEDDDAKVTAQDESCHDANDDGSGVDTSQWTPLNVELDPLQTGTRCTLLGLLKWNIATVQPQSISLQVLCTSCGKRQHDMMVHGDFLERSEVAQRCGCGAILRARLRPCLVHDSSSVLWHCDVESLRVVDILSSVVRASCIKCFEPFLMPLKANVRAEHTCYTCFQKLALAAKTLALDELSGKSGATSGLAERLQKVRHAAGGDRSQGVVAGKPLPDNGACKHFRKSYRWLRFPCCGKAWPCPLCHEGSDCEASAYGILATRVICGFCAHEHNYSGKSVCPSCNKHTTAATSSHWDGGGGLRDTAGLSTKDSRKNKGVSRSGNSKTHSKKAQRVGLAGKIRTAANSPAAS